RPGRARHDGGLGPDARRDGHAREDRQRREERAMSTAMGSAKRALFRLELADAMRSRWMVFTAAIYALVFSGFVWLGLRESRVLGFTGLSRVVLNVAHAVVLAVPLVALVATTQTIVRARQSGFFELMLS